MRVTLVSPFDPEPPPGSGDAGRVGSPERAVGEVARRLSARGHHVTLLCSSQAAPAVPDRHGHLEVVRAPRLGTLLKAPVADLSGRIPADADVVHVVATDPFTTAAVLRRARRLGVPGVLDAHVEPSGPAGASLLGRLAERLAHRAGPGPPGLADVALVRSMAQGRGCPALQAIPPDRWRLVPDGVDVGRFHADGPPCPGDYLLFAGRLAPPAGLQVLLDALKWHPLRLPLLVAGEGPQRRSMEAAAARADLPVRFLGPVADGDLPALFRGARLTVLPSLPGDTAFRTPLLESLACGTPVVASRLPCAAELAGPGLLLAKPGDPFSLSRQLQEGAQAWSLPRGRPLADATRAAHSWDAVAGRLEEIYGEAAGRPAAVPAAVPAG